MASARLVSMAIFCFAFALVPEAAVASLQARTADRSGVAGDDDGDDGGAGGLAGALSGLLGGGGGGGGEEGGEDDDSDPNMVDSDATKKKKKKKATKKTGGVDLSGLESGLKTGGIGGLMGMLKTMRAAQSPTDMHIKTDKNGEEMYDFRDLDDGFSTTPEPKPVVVHTPTLPPMPVVAVPRMPTISLPGKPGKMKGMKAAEAEVAADESERKSNGGRKLVVWPPRPASSPLQQEAAVVLPSQVAAASPSLGGVSAVPASGLYQGLAMMRQSVDTLMNEAAALNGGSAGAPALAGVGDGPLVAKLDQLTQSFMSEKNSMEKRVETLEEDNAEMKHELAEQAKEIGAARQNAKDRQAPKFPTKPWNATSAAPKYATKPWNATFAVHLDGTSTEPVHTFIVQVHPEWAPEGAKRFQDMIQAGILQGARFFRVVPGFMVQFGIPGAPDVAAAWVHKLIPDDPVKKSNRRGVMTFAKSGPNTRTTQMFINYGNNKFLDKQGFAPFAEVLGDGMGVVDKIQSKYKEQPNQGKIQHLGNKYLVKHFPDLSFVAHVDSTLTSSSQATGFLQGSAIPKASENIEKARRYGAIATFFHNKRKMED